MPQINLSESEIGKIRIPVDKDKVAFTDPAIKQLQLLVKWKSGVVRLKTAKNGDFNFSWFYRYQVPDPLVKRRTQLKLGEWPTMTVFEAKKELERCVQMVASGVDPKASMLKDRAEMIQANITIGQRSNVPPRFRFESVVDRFREEWSLTGKKQSTLDNYLCDIQHHILPKFAGRDIRTITGGEWDDLVMDLANVQNKPGAASNTHKAGRRLLSYAVDKELINANPLLGRKRSLEATRLEPDARFLDAEEVHKFISQVRDIYAELWVRVQIELMLRVGVRAEEWSRVKISWVSLKKMQISHPGESMKNGEKAVTHLTETAVKLIIKWLKYLKEKFGEIDQEWYLFGEAEDPSLPRKLQLVDATRKIDNWVDFTPKILRKTLSTHLQRQGCPPQVLRAIRNQSVTEGVEAHYDFDDLFHMKKQWIEKWDELLVEAAKSPNALLTDRDSVLEGDLASEVDDLFS